MQSGSRRDIFLQHLPAIGRRHLLTLINGSYGESQTSAKWPTSTLVAVPKPGVRNKFRPISLPSVISRTAERMINWVYAQWLQLLLPPFQGGFLKGQSTDEQLGVLCESIKPGWNRKKTGTRSLL